MMILRAVVAALVVGAAPAAAQCGTAGFKVAGSSTVYPIAKLLGQNYASDCPGFSPAVVAESSSGFPASNDGNIYIASGGSGAGASQVCSGFVDIGNMSREWRTSEATTSDDWNFRCAASGNRLLTRVDIAIDGVTVVVKRGGTGSICINTLKGLTPDQLRFMYSSFTKQQLIQAGWPASAVSLGKGGDGKIWSNLHRSCADKEINLSGPDQANSGTSDFFKEKIFKSNGETIYVQGTRPYKGSVDDIDTLTYVQNDDAAIGFFGYTYYFSNSATIFAAPIRNRNGVYVTPSKATILSNEYNPLTRRIYMNLNKASLGATRPFLEYSYSTKGDGLISGIGSDPVPAADQILMLSRLGSSKGIDISNIECDTNGSIRVGTNTGIPGQRSRFNIWSLLYNAKCPKVDVVLAGVTPTSANGQALSRTCTTGTNALEVGVTSAPADNSVYTAASDGFTLSCPSPSVKKLIELTVSPGVYAYVNNANAVYPISRGFLRFCLSTEGTTLLGLIGLQGNTASVNTDMLSRIPKAGGICFSGSNSVEVQGKGEVAMKDLAIGDMVKVAGGKFSEIYSFGHYEHDVEASFLSIDAGLEKPLVLSGDHMVFVDGKAVAASTVAVGDKLSLVGGLATVKAIKAVTEAGVFAPFTKDGTIVVNSVVASSYVNLKGDSTLVIGGIFAFDLHWLAHLSQAPHRLACEISSSFCASETYNHGVSAWVEAPLAFSLWLVKQNAFVMTAVFIPAFSLVFIAAAVEAVVSSPVLLLILVASAFVMATKSKKSA